MLFDMIGGLGHMASQGMGRIGHMASQGVASGMRTVADLLSPTKPDPGTQSIGAIQGAPMARDSRQTLQPAGAAPSAMSLKDLVLAAVDADRDGKMSHAEASAFLADLMGDPLKGSSPATAESSPPMPRPVSRRTDPPLEFARVDLNGDGRVTAAEVRAHEVRAAFDADQDGSISKKEYLNGTRGAARMRRDEDFDRQDANGDGKLDAAELVRSETPAPGDHALAARLNATNVGRFDHNGDGMVDGREVAVRHLLDRGDRDGDRRLSFDEFLTQQAKPTSASGGDGLGATFGQMMRRAGHVAEAHGRFAALDRDGDGKLSAEELRGLARPRQADYRLAADLSEGAGA